ncbi:MAG: TonB-dependent receptor [Bryobacterales bacterium]
MSATVFRRPLAAVLVDPLRHCAAAAMLLVVAAEVGVAQPAGQHDLTEMSLEDLLSIEVTSVARREQKLSQSASAIYVITQEDIRRSGVTTLPDALRLAPGVQVMQMDGGKWGVSIRGFNGRFANKLLVMIDGRSIYSPIFAGVYWEANDVLLEDVDRIEVIRGPGATMWGSNAVNGVINIITKHTSETQGVRVTAGGGNQEGGFGSARLGGAAGSKFHYRFYSKYNSRSGLLLPSGERANDNLRKSQGGFRLDWQPSERDDVMLSGDAYEGGNGERYVLTLRVPPYQQETAYRDSFSGTNLLARWTHRHSERAQTQFQIYFDRVNRDSLLDRNTSFSLGDAEVQYQHDLSSHRLMFGVGYRVSRDYTPAEWAGTFDPQRRTLQRVNTFVQDEITLLPGKLFLTLGSKFENNTYVDWRAQPSISLLANVTDRSTVWLSAAHAEKSPSRVERDLIVDIFAAPGPQGSLLVGQVRGSEEVGPEQLRAFEGGYRFSPLRGLSFDLAGFYNVYEDLVGIVEQPPVFVGGTPPTTLLPQVFANAEEGHRLYGAEAAASWRPLEAGALRLSYAWLRGSTGGEAYLTGSGHQLLARWSWNLPGNIEWDSSYRFTDAFSTIPAYHRVDTRLGWRPARRWELSVVGQHLLDSQHLESPPLFAVPTEIGRSIYGKLTWGF